MLAIKIVCCCPWLDHSFTGAQFIFAWKLETLLCGGIKICSLLLLLYSFIAGKYGQSWSYGTQIYCLKISRLLVSVLNMLAFTISRCLWTWAIQLNGELGGCVNFWINWCSTIAEDVGACFATAAPSKGWFYVDREIHLLESVILAKSLRKQHTTNWDMDTKV